MSPYLEDFGFSRTHRRDAEAFRETDFGLEETFANDITEQLTQPEQYFPEDSIPGGSVESIGVNKLTTGSITSQKINLAVTDGAGDVWIAAGKTGFNDTTNGFILGIDDSDSNKVKFSIGDADNGMDWNQTASNTLTIKGTLTSGSLHIPDQDTTANSFHVNSSGDMWLGATETDFNANNDNAEAYVLKTGIAKFQDVTVENTADQSKIKVIGTLTSRQDFTAGWDITQGEVVAIESDGSVYPSRVTDIDTLVDSDELLGATGRTGDSATERVSNSVVFTVMISGGALKGQRTVYDRVTQTITSISVRTTLTTSGTSKPALVRMSDTTCLMASYLASGTNVYLQLISGLDTGITTNTEIEVDGTARNPQLVKVDDTHAIIVYTDSVTEDLKAKLVTISGTTVSVGTEQSVHTAASSDEVMDVVRYEDSEYYGILFTDGSFKVITFQFDGTTFTFGSAISISVSGTLSRAQLASLTSTTIALVNTDDSVNLKARVITRTGTTSVASTAVTITTFGSGLGNSDTAVAAMGEDSIAVYFADGSASPRLDIALVRITGTVPSLLGTVKTGSGSNNEEPWNGSIQLVAPDLLMVTREDTGEDDLFELYSLTNNYSTVIGIAAADIADAATGSVVLSAFSDDASGLTTATQYFVGVDGDLITKEEGGLDQFGISLSSTEIKVTI